MKLFNWESFKKPTNKEIEKENIPIHEEKDRKNLQTKNLQTENFQPEVFEEEHKLTENDPEKKFIPIENIPEDFDWENFILNKIDNPDDKSEEEQEEIKTPAGIHRPAFVNDIIRKYSLPNEEWKRLTPTQREQKKQGAQKEIQELFIHQPKKMKRKDKKEKTEMTA